jgi:hypothetical protein
VPLAMSTERAIGELLHGLLPERRLRSNARVVRRKMSCFNVKRARHPGTARSDPASRREPPGPRGTLSYRYSHLSATSRTIRDASAIRYRADTTVAATMTSLTIKTALRSTL